MVKRKWLEEVEVEEESLSLLDWLGLEWIERPGVNGSAGEEHWGSPGVCSYLDGPLQDLKEGNYEFLRDLRKA